MALAAAVFAAFTGWAQAADFGVGLSAYVSGDFQAALHEWQPLAKAGNPQAQFALGQLYDLGRGVPRDDREAIRWYRMAAEQGYVRAETALGLHYARGRGVPQDMSQAIAWWRKGAEQGSPTAQYYLAEAYRYGTGVPQDLEAAQRWYWRADASGHVGARDKVWEVIGMRQGRGGETSTLPVAEGGETPAAEPASSMIVTTGRVLRSGKAVLLPLPLPSASEEEVAPAPSPEVAAAEAAAVAGDEAPAAPAEGTEGATVASLPPEEAVAPSDAGYRVWLASYRSSAQAEAGWREFREQHRDLLGELTPMILEVDLGPDAGLFYRLQAGPLADKESARALCDALGRREVFCVAVNP